jgi:hypothetical protein
MGKLKKGLGEGRLSGCQGGQSLALTGIDHCPWNGVHDSGELKIAIPQNPMDLSEFVLQFSLAEVTDCQQINTPSPHLCLDPSSQLSRTEDGANCEPLSQAFGPEGRVEKFRKPPHSLSYRSRQRSLPAPTSLRISRNGKFAALTPYMGTGSFLENSDPLEFSVRFAGDHLLRRSILRFTWNG